MFFSCLSFMKESFDLELNLIQIFGVKSRSGQIPYYSPFQKGFITVSGYAFGTLIDLFHSYLIRI